MPDLKKQELERKAEETRAEKARPVIAEFSYDNTLEETDAAMKTYQQHFASKRGRLSIAAYSLLGAAAIVGIVITPTQIVLYLALAFCAFGLYFTFTDKKRMRAKVLETLKNMNPEEYHCRILENKIEIETVIKPKPEEIDSSKKKLDVELDANDSLDASKEAAESVSDEETSEEDNKPIKSVFIFGADMLDLLENDGALLLILARRQIYCFPKRCLGDNAVKTVRDFLEKKLYGEQ